jgi:hypothetical protein
VKTIRLFQQISLQGDIKSLCVFVDLTVKTLNPSVGFPQLSTGSTTVHTVLEFSGKSTVVGGKFYCITDYSGFSKMSKRVSYDTPGTMYWFFPRNKLTDRD